MAKSLQGPQTALPDQPRPRHASAGLNRGTSRLLIPRGTRRHRLWQLGTKFARIWLQDGPSTAILKATVRIRRGLSAFWTRRQLAEFRSMVQAGIDFSSQRPAVRPHTASVDVIVCVHNALDDVHRCLESVQRSSSPPFSLILVDDGSFTETAHYLADFAVAHGCRLSRNETARGYTYAANQGLRASTAEFVVLLNSDTIVAPEWLDRLIACARSDPQIGLVGPLSNTASWQSIPELVGSEADWAENPLPGGMAPEDMARLVARYSGRIYPRLPFLNGFCLMIRRAVLDQVGLFDEAVFGRGYGEENDYSLRSTQAGWQLAVADDAYVFHRQSRSYSNERRKALCEHAGLSLVKKHGSGLVDAGVEICRDNRVLDGIRHRARVMHEREQWIREGRSRWAGNRLLFILPVMGPGGGANVIIQEADAMSRMGVDVRFLNLEEYRTDFENSYPELKVPVIYRECCEDLVELAGQFDAFVATVYYTAQRLLPLLERHQPPVLGYYVQDFEPYFVPEGTKEHHEAWGSYTVIPQMVRFTKTEWTRNEVLRHTGADCHLVGPSVNIDFFRPRPRSKRSRSDAVRIGAMIRPSSPYREPRLTMEVLQETYRLHRGKIELLLFGCDSIDPGFLALPRRFPWRNSGVLNRIQLSHLLNEVDVFVDFSSHQAMGLTAMEAMACGAAVVVPRRGGANCFVNHETNGLIVDTRSFRECVSAVSLLVSDASLRSRLQGRGRSDICQFYPERAACRILAALFPRP